MNSSLCVEFFVLFLFLVFHFLFVRVIGNGVRGMRGDCEKDTGKSSKYFKFCIWSGLQSKLWMLPLFYL